MPTLVPIADLSPQVRDAFEEGYLAVFKTHLQRPMLDYKSRDLLLRFSGHYQHLSALPRRMRRTLERRWKCTLSAIALLMTLGPRDEKVAMDGKGNFVATWMNYSEDPNDTGFGPNIFAQHFAGPDDTRAGCAGFIPNIVGTLVNDSLQGLAADDVIHGLGGNDLLKGGGGADIICGGAGDDQLFGEQGTDHLLGGLGDDVLDGGSESDICNGNGQTNADTALACETVLQVP